MPKGGSKSRHGGFICRKENSSGGVSAMFMRLVGDPGGGVGGGIESIRDLDVG